VPVSQASNSYSECSLFHSVEQPWPPGVGTGLGLALAHGFAEQSNGLLRITSTPGKGTVVTLVLPVAAAALAPAASVQVD